MIFHSLFQYFSACYLALETVEIQPSGSVEFLPHTDITEMKPAYLAPEFQTKSVTTEKVHLEIYISCL